MDCGNSSWNSDPFGGGQEFGGNSLGGPFRRGIDEPTLRQIAEMTGGTYYSASSAGELQEVFEELPTYLITKEEIMEVSVAFAAVGALLAAIAVALAMMWRPLP
jgi:Ca-activated chloride channel family protein